jgi:hypothetical protein
MTMGRTPTSPRRARRHSRLTRGRGVHQQDLFVRGVTECVNHQYAVGPTEAPFVNLRKSDNARA